MTREQIIYYLQKYAGESILYRVNRDILKISINEDFMVNLQDKILYKPKVIKLLKNQHENGWFGNELHGGTPPGVDVSINALISYGVEKSHSSLKKIVHCLLNPANGEGYRRWFRGGFALDEDGRGGNNAIIAGVLSQLGEENNSIVKEEIALSLKHFSGALKHTNINDYTVTTKSGITYYKKHALFPGANHFSLLNNTNNWRSKENIETLKKSIKHCFALMDDFDKYLTFKNNNHFVGPFNFDWHINKFKIDEILKDSYKLVWWMRILYQVSKLGIIRDVPELIESFTYLEELLYSNNIYLKQTDMSKKRFKDILSLENSWKNEESMKCDFLFSGLIILNNAGL